MTEIHDQEHDLVDSVDDATTREVDHEEEVEPAELTDTDSSRASVKALAIQLAQENLLDLFVDDQRRAYAVARVGETSEVLPVQGQGFQHWLRALWMRNTNDSLGDVVRDVAENLAALATYSGSVQPVYVRFAREDDGNVWLDLANTDREAVHVDRVGWRVVPSNEVPVRFLRSKNTLPLPTPQRGGDVRELLRFLNLPDDDGGPFELDSGRDDPDSLVLVLGFLLTAISGRGAYPVLVLQGEQGSAKTSTIRNLVRLLDPRRPETRAAPNCERDLAISAAGSGLLAFDNLSLIKPQLSDAFCRIATGAGLTTRQLYSDSEETIFDATRPLLMNGIPSLIERPDLASRSIVLHLPRITAARRKTSAHLDREFEQRRPYILGALLDGVSTGLRNESRPVASLPRLADASAFVHRCEPEYGWEGRFWRALIANQQQQVARQLGDDPVARGLRRCAAEPELRESLGIRRDQSWLVATATGWLRALATLVDRDGLPKSAAVLGNTFRRLQPALREVGILLEPGRHTARGNEWRMRPVEGDQIDA